MIGDGLGNTNDMDSHNFCNHNSDNMNDADSHNKVYSGGDKLRQACDNGNKLMNDIYCSHIYDDYNYDDFDGSHVRNRQTLC